MYRNKLSLAFTIIVIILVILSIIYIFRINSNLKNDNIQLSILENIYKEYIGPHEYIIYDTSAYKNFITNVEYSSQDMERLLKLNKSYNPTQRYILSIKYNKSEKILTVTKSTIDKEYFYTQKYKLCPNFSGIKYTKYGKAEENKILE